MANLGLYVHIPFCDKLCKYCDFAKVRSHVVDHNVYLQALKKEYDLYTEGEVNQFIFDTVYFGGGTPSALSVNDLSTLLKIFEPILVQAKEVTFEANPESLSVEKIKVLRQYHVNRVSLGVQTFDEQRLRFLNRGHTNEQVVKVCQALREHGIKNINLDLMYGLPQQTVTDVEADVLKMLTLTPTHISTYALIFEPHTPFYLQLKQHKLHEVDEDTQAMMYRVLQEKFTAAGYVQYEFSNWAQPGFGSQHNMKYWNLTEYIAVGLGAHGFYRGVRYANTRSIANYLAVIEKQDRKPIVKAQQLTQREAMEEMMFLGLRLQEGVAKKSFSAQFGVSIETVFAEAIEKHVNARHLIETDTHYRLAKEAVFISNEILSDFLLEEEKE